MYLRIRMINCIIKKYLKEFVKMFFLSNIMKDKLFVCVLYDLKYFIKNKWIYYSSGRREIFFDFV